jgi:uncharacterized protein YdcH (DUF465 family)
MTDTATLTHDSVAVIEAEHAALAAVLSGLRYFVRNAARGIPPDAAVLEKMLDYVEHFPERLHHPREDEHLFRRLRARTHEVDDMLDRLEAEHEAGEQRLQDLRGARPSHGGGLAGDPRRLLHRARPAHRRGRPRRVHPAVPRHREDRAGAGGVGHLRPQPAGAPSHDLGGSATNPAGNGCGSRGFGCGITPRATRLAWLSYQMLITSLGESDSRSKLV